MAATYADASSGDATASSTGTVYTSSNPAVATVDAEGLVTARGTGTAILLALNEGAVGLAAVSVLSATLDALEVTPTETVLVINPIYGTPTASLQVVGRLREFRSARLAGLRSWPVPGFPKHLIFYRVDEDLVEVVRVLHGARDLAIVLEDEG